MKDWKLDISQFPGPRYLAVAKAIDLALDTGEMQAGARLPSQRDLASQLGVTVGTISRAFEVAKKRGLIKGEVGRGTFARGEHKKTAGLDYSVQGADKGIDLTCFRSPVEGLTGILAEAFSEFSHWSSRIPLHRYPAGAGFYPHRVAGANWIARTGWSPPAEEIIVCGGAQQAVITALTGFADPGDTVLTETLTYAGVREFANLFHLNLEEVALDEGGMIPDALEAACAKSSAKLVYLQPTIHNPTTWSMAEDRRRRIAEIAKARDLVLIEDDAAASAVTDRPPPIAAFAPERTCYITSVSKSISPALRIGYLRCPPTEVERLVGTFHTLTLSVSPIVAEFAAYLITNGIAEMIATKLVEELGERHILAAELLAPGSFHSHPAAFNIWLTLPQQWRTDDFSDAARSEGVWVVDSDKFVVGRANPPHAMRVSLSPASNGREELRRGLAVLAGLLAKHPRPRYAVV